MPSCNILTQLKMRYQVSEDTMELVFSNVSNFASIRRRSSFRSAEHVANTHSFKHPHRKKSGELKSGLRGGHNGREMRRSPKKSLRNASLQQYELSLRLAEKCNRVRQVPAVKWIAWQSTINFGNNSTLKKNGPHNAPARNSTPQAEFFRVQTCFPVFLRLLRRPDAIILRVNKSVWWNHASSVKNIWLKTAILFREKFNNHWQKFNRRGQAGGFNSCTSCKRYGFSCKVRNIRWLDVRENYMNWFGTTVQWVSDIVLICTNSLVPYFC